MVLLYVKKKIPTTKDWIEGNDKREPMVRWLIKDLR
jgi:hypothetical protein